MLFKARFNGLCSRPYGILCSLVGELFLRILVRGDRGSRQLQSIGGFDGTFLQFVVSFGVSFRIALRISNIDGLVILYSAFMVRDGGFSYLSSVFFMRRAKCELGGIGNMPSFEIVDRNVFTDLEHFVQVASDIPVINDGAASYVRVYVS